MVDEQQSPENPDEEHGEAFTDDASVRVKYLGSGLAFIVICSFIGLVTISVLGYGSLNSISAGTFSVLALLVLAAGTYAFGIDLVKKYMNK
jgi:hypothetical protein